MFFIVNVFLQLNVKKVKRIEKTHYITKTRKQKIKETLKNRKT